MEELKQDNEQQVQEVENKPQEAVKPKKKPSRTVVVLSVLVILLIAGAGFLGWQLYEERDTNKQQAAEIQNLQTELTQYQEAAEANPTPTPTPTVSTAALQENVAAALNTMNTAALEGYMADSVFVVYAASEYAGNRTPSEAVADLDYLSSATAPWDFNLDAATLASYKAGFYADYFGDGYLVGKSTDDYVVSFRVDADGNIDQIFIAANADLLL